jgi:hypothetical protein
MPHPAQFRPGYTTPGVFQVLAKKKASTKLSTEELW